MWGALAELLVALLKWFFKSKPVQETANVAENAKNPDSIMFADPERMRKFGAERDRERGGVHAGKAGESGIRSERSGEASNSQGAGSGQGREADPGKD